MALPWTKTVLVGGVLLGFLLGLGSSRVFPFAVVLSTEDILQRRFAKIESFFTVYYECTSELPPYKEFHNTRGGKVSWSSSLPDGKTVVVKLKSTLNDSQTDGTAINRTFEHSFSLVGDANLSRPSP